MKYSKLPFLILVSFLFFALLSCCSSQEKRVHGKSGEKVDFAVLPFEIEDVKLLDGPFLHATELNEQSLLNYEPDRFLAKFRIEAGLQPKAEHYHGWEDNTIAGHSLGHYLSAVSLMYASTGKEEFLQRANYIVDELYECQQADGEGYIGAFPDGKKILEDEVAKGDIRSQGFNLNGIWVPFYTEHKVMAGLFDAYKYCHNAKALEINIKFAKWLETVVKDLNDNQIQIMLNCEHGGINESLAELYGITGDEEFLKLSKVFHHKAILDSLAHGVDILPGKHANTQIPKLVGVARRYELTGDEADKKTAEFFWDRVVHHHSYVTGGNGNYEYFGPSDTLSERLSDATTETCNVYNMLKLTAHLFEWNADPAEADFYERALFNHILSSQNPHDGHVVYNLSLDMGGFKEYQDPHWFTCCVGTGMENHSKYSKNIFYHNDQALYVSQFIASELNWKDKGVRVLQQTSYPEEQGTTLFISCEKPSKFELKVRYPEWAKDGITVVVNGKEKKIDAQPGSFVVVGKKWNDGDKVEVKFPFALRLEAMPDNDKRVSVMYGPLVLAGDLGEIDSPNSNDPMFVPVLMTSSRDPKEWLTPVDGKPNTFKTKNVGQPRDITLKPFYQTTDRRYSVYWDMYTPEEWAVQQKAYEEERTKKADMEKNTIDLFRLGEMQPERDHQFKDQDSHIGELKTKKFREIERGGTMSFVMKSKKNVPVSLVFEYWGGYSGSKTFDILVEGQVIATENISALAKSKFVDITYNVPEDLVKDKDRFEVKIVPHYGHRGGPIFTVRTVTR